MGSTKDKEEAIGQVMEEPIRFGCFTSIEKKVEKYLGDMFSSEGQDIGEMATIVYIIGLTII